ncbi:pentapeptide repeat-containing protein [Streptomyces tibetensis]|uniref:pentapeptide repeat-containing protein n=1 Tax=Streptomyces tibetensis TaxID=2382123 RepID=UPI0037F8347E
MSDEQPGAGSRPWWFWPAAIVGTVLFAAGLVWGPWWIERDHLRDKAGELVPSAGIIVTGFRTMFIAIAAGVFTAVGLWYTHRSHQQTERLFEHTRNKDREQADLTREGQVTGRYVEAIKLLASEKLHERLGGIYALERIMKDSDRDHRTIVEVLSAFVRTALQEAEAKRSADRPGAARAAASKREAGTRRYELSEDVKAALTVLSRRKATRRGKVPAELPDARLAQHDLVGTTWRAMNLERANFEGSCLREADFDQAHLDGADFDRVTLTKASLRRASLNNARLEEADLVRTDFTNSRLVSGHLPRAILNRAVLCDVNLLHANLDGASLNEVTLERASLRHAKLRGARLREANLSGADLERANLGHAHMRGADCAGARLHSTVLDSADLRGAKLEEALGLDVRQLLQARIDSGTTLPQALADDPAVRKHLEEWEAMEADERDAALEDRLAHEASMADGTGAEPN